MANHDYEMGSARIRCPPSVSLFLPGVFFFYRLLLTRVGGSFAICLEAETRILVPSVIFDKLSCVPIVLAVICVGRKLHVYVQIHTQ